MRILCDLFQKAEADGAIPNSFQEAGIPLTTKPNRHWGKKKKLQTNVSHERRCKKFQQILVNRIHQCTKITRHDQVGFVPGIQGWFNTEIS